MSDPYIAVIIAASQIAKDAILKRTANNEIQRMELLAHYKIHSEQLVTALLQWGKKMNFSICEYVDGELLFSYQTPPSGIPYLEDALKHVAKSRPEILESYEYMESRHKDLCSQINQVMSRESVIPSKPSYENIILSKINQVCPQLKSSNDVTLEENNVFLIHRILKTIFEKVYWEKSQIRLFIEPKSTDKVYLLTDRIRVFAQGTLEDMANLKAALEELIVHSEVAARIKEYKQLQDQFTNNEDSDKLREKIQRIYDLIHGGKFLGGFGVCYLCEPDTYVSEC